MLILFFCDMHGSLGILSIVHLDHSRENGWESLASDILRTFEVPHSAVDVNKEEGEGEGREGK